jgi:hypothetical protein
MLNEHCVCVCGCVCVGVGVCVCGCGCVSILVKMSSHCEPQPNQGQRHKQTVLLNSLFCLTTLDQSEKQYKIDMEGVWCCPFSNIVVLAQKASEACICIIMHTA